jgi:peptidoglycan/LPS O-acetylase OafA/YrhL
MEHLKAHTGLRGIAALVVAPIHMYCEVFVKGFDRTIMPWLNGMLAVDIFFILSGFILPYVYCNDSTAMKNGWRKFYVARFARIYPLHLATMAAAGFMVITGHFLNLSMGRPYYWSDIPPQLLLIHPFPGIEVWGWIHPSWSISMEAFAYLILFPIACILIRIKSGIGIKIFMLGLLAILYGFTYETCDKPDENSAMGWFAIGRVTSCFTMGMILWSIFHNHPKITRSLQKQSTLLLGAFLAAYVASSMGFIQFQLLVLIVPWLILSLTSNNPSFANLILANRFVVWLGTISYSIYLIHTLFGKVIAGLSSHISPGPVGGCFLLIGMFSALIAVSGLSYRFFENPARRWLQHKLNPERHP